MALANDADRDWQTWGKTNPYFGVLSDPKFLNVNLTDESITEFFASGARHVEHVYGVIRAHVQPDFQPARVLDYGCGVGRLLIPLAQRAHTAVGVDISPGMLEQARENSRKFNAGSVCLLHVDEMELLEPASFDFVHSFIVFQHIPVARGELILRRLITLIAEGGVGAIHLTYSDTRSAPRRAVLALRQRVNFAHVLLNMIQRLPLSNPLMQMNSYSINRVCDILIDSHCSNLHVEFVDHGGFRGVMFYFEKLARPLL